MHFTQVLDYTGAIFAFLSTVYYIKADKLAWPIGLVAIVINFVLYWKSGLYADTALNAIYFISTFYGWYQWLYGGENKTALPISSVPMKTAMVLIAIASVSVVLVSQSLIQFTNSQVPYWDATTMVLSLVAQWLICRKYIQTWMVWFVVDAMYVGLYLYKGLPAHTALLSIYLLMAIIGFVRWRRESRISSYFTQAV